jgi:hypothetical protein
MSIQTTIDSASKAIGKIDPTAVNDRIAQVEADKAEWLATIATAQETLSAVSRRINDYDGPDGEAAGDALLRGGDVLTAARGLDLLKSERDALRSGIRDLNRRIEEADKEIYGLREDFGNQVLQSFAPVADELERQAKASAVALYALYASAAAIHDCTRANSALTLRHQLEGAIKLLARFDSVAPVERIAVPAEIQALLRTLDGLGVAFPHHVPEKITVPW